MTDEEGKNLELGATSFSPTNSDLEEKLDSLPPDERERFIEIMTMQSYSGPVMHPQLLRDLEQIIQGGAERVLALSEKEQAHRHKIVEQKVSTETWQIKVSLMAGVIAFISLIAGIVYCSAHNYESGVVALGVATAFGVVSQFIQLGMKSQKKTAKK